MKDCGDTCDLGARVMELEKKQQSLEDRLDTNTTLIQEVKSDTAQIVEFFQAAAGGAKMLKHLITLLKWASVASISVASIWYIFRHGGNPPPG